MFFLLVLCCKYSLLVCNQHDFLNLCYRTENFQTEIIIRMRGKAEKDKAKAMKVAAAVSGNLRAPSSSSLSTAISLSYQPEISSVQEWSP